MNKISKQLSGLSKSKNVFIKHHLDVKTRVKELMSNAIKKDKGENLSELLEPFENRFDEYMADIVKECNTSLSVYDKTRDEYYMINKERECINLTSLTTNYSRLPLSEWLFRYSSYFFDCEVELPEEISWGFNQSEDTFNMVAMIFMEGIQIAEENGFSDIGSSIFFANSSAKGTYIPMESYQMDEPSKGLNEVHLIMTRLNDILLKYPITIVGSPFSFDLKLEFGFENGFDLSNEYKGYRSELESTPFETISMIEMEMNEYVIDQLNEGIQQD
jgi:hypothetical protein